MIYKSFRINCLIRVLLMGITLYVFFYHYFNFERPATVFIAGTLFLFQLYLMFKYVEKTNKTLSRFLHSIKYSDFSLNFPSELQDSGYKELHDSFNEVVAEFKRTKTEKEEHYRYLQTVVKHVGVGLISYFDNGDVDMINNSAKNMLGIPHLNNIKALESVSPELAELLFKITAGKKEFIEIKIADDLLQLSIRATGFFIQDKSFRLVSIQNIQKEIEAKEIETLKGLIKVQTNQLLEEQTEKLRMSEELQIARNIQKGFLPSTIPETPGLEAAALNSSCLEVGGDYHDVITFPDNKTVVTIGDVSGKGAGAALLMANLQASVRSLVDSCCSLEEAVKRINNLIHNNTSPEKYITFFIGRFDPADNTFSYVNAGHNPPIYFNGDNSRTELSEGGLILGFEQDAEYEEKTLQLKPSERILMYTDGV